MGGGQNRWGIDLARRAEIEGESGRAPALFFPSISRAVGPMDQRLAGFFLRAAADDRRVDSHARSLAHGGGGGGGGTAGSASGRTAGARTGGTGAETNGGGGGCPVRPAT
jgi:hypothetical protein